jgi:hypothetical protein
MGVYMAVRSALDWSARLQVYQQLDKKFQDAISVALNLYVTSISATNVLERLNMNTGQAWRAEVAHSDIASARCAEVSASSPGG